MNIQNIVKSYLRIDTRSLAGTSMVHKINVSLKRKDNYLRFPLFKHNLAVVVFCHFCSSVL